MQKIFALRVIFYNHMRHFQSNFRIISVQFPQYVINSPVTEHSPLHINYFCKNGHASGGANNMHPISGGGGGGANVKDPSLIYLNSNVPVTCMFLHRLLIAALIFSNGYLQFKRGLRSNWIVLLFCFFTHFGFFTSVRSQVLITLE